MQSAFHGQTDHEQASHTGKHITGWEWDLAYRFYTHFHPYGDALDKRLLEGSVAGLLAADTKLKTTPAGKPTPADYELYEPFFADYDPNPELVPNTKESPWPVKDLDFTSSGAYAVYNWELFFHSSLTAAIHLSKNQRFEEAQNWFHTLFDPTDDSDGPTPERFWKVQPFQTTDVKRMEEILVNLVTGDDPGLKEETLNSMAIWADKPFRPYAVARHRHWAYMYKTVMAYLDNLIAWGDSLFRQDTGESINEATQLYVLAANILGPRPQAVPKKGSVRPQTYASLKKDLQQFGTALVPLETDMPFDIAPLPQVASNTNQSSTLRSLSYLYFCVPPNDKLLSYWDTVADRFFKLRNSLNLQGIFRQLALFEPPIDPALLARAAAAGLDVSAIISGLNQPLPLVRFQFLVQKAAELCQEVKSLGSNLLGAMEKEDNEALSLLRAKHERLILELAESVRLAQWHETKKQSEALQVSLASAILRFTYYERLLGETEENIKAKVTSELDLLDTETLKKEGFATTEPQVAARPIEVDIAKGGPGIVASISGTAFKALGIDANLGHSDITGGKKISSYEFTELNYLEAAQWVKDLVAITRVIGSSLHLIPDFAVHLQPLGVGAGIEMGGTNFGLMIDLLAKAGDALGDRLSYGATRAGKIGGYARREQEWAFQSNQAAGEINQILRQLRAAQIREAIAEWEWENHQQQIKNAQEIEHFLSGEQTSITEDSSHKKISTQALYTWMKREVRGLYSECFQFAFDVAKKAERALQHELGDPDLHYLEFGYRGGKEGLLAGEKLYLDIKRMEMAYHDLNQREYELVKHVSLRQVNPLALLQLRATGRCTVTLPEELFDMDGPGHYFRRIKSVALTIPCVSGPYASVNCTLTLLKSAIRKNSLLRDGSYAQESAEDERFSAYYGSLQSIVTSSAQNDSGLFETNLHDERYLPFEGSGAVSEWQLQLPANPSQGEPRQFDYDTISDVILHIRYTAREGGGLLRNGAMANLKQKIGEAQAAGSIQLFSVRHEFPNAWTQFKDVTIEGKTLVAPLTLTLKKDHFPFWSQGWLKQITLQQVELFAKGGKSHVDITDATTSIGTLVTDKSLGDLRVGKLANTPLPEVEQEFTLNFSDNTMEELWLAVTWGGQGT